MMSHLEKKYDCDLGSRRTAPLNKESVYFEQLILFSQKLLQYVFRNYKNNILSI